MTLDYHCSAQLQITPLKIIPLKHFKAAMLCGGSLKHNYHHDAMLLSGVHHQHEKKDISYILGFLFTKKQFLSLKVSARSLIFRCQRSSSSSVKQSPQRLQSAWVSLHGKTHRVPQRHMDDRCNLFHYTTKVTKELHECCDQAISLALLSWNLF